MAWQQGVEQSQDRWPELDQRLFHMVWYYAEGHNAVGAAALSTSS